MVPPLGGAVNTWTVRWAAPSYARPGDGNQYYVGMESVGGTPTFFLGRSGGSLRRLRLTSLDPGDFRAALDTLLR